MTFLIVSCEMDKYADSITEVRYDFDLVRMINVKNDINVILVQDSLNYISVSAPEEMQELVKPEFKGDTIALTNNNKGKILNRYGYEVTVEVHFTDLKVLFLQGGGKISNIDTIQLDYLGIWTNGAIGQMHMNCEIGNIHLGLSTGNIEMVLKGKTDFLEIWTTSYVVMDFLKLDSKKVSIRNNSPTDCYVNVQEHLVSNVQSVGNVYYKGNPPVLEIKETGKGKTIKLQ